MPKYLHEIRDPIHVFVRLDSDERAVVDSLPVQRLRSIHQLALSYLVYPGATHRRFEHSLGVMELAGRVFDVITEPDNVSDQIRTLVPEIGSRTQRDYWRRALRIAALCHDIGHLPFSHAAEHELLPEGWTHERLTRELLMSDEMVQLLQQMTPPLRPHDVAKLAVGPEKAPDLPFSTWEALLCEIVVSDAFGADRMDYLLRDGHHAGVAYGTFDHYRLIDCLRVLPRPPAGGDTGDKPVLGVVEGGVRSAEALLIARYMMFTQIYYHPIRQVYDLHLQDFLSAWLDGGRFGTELPRHLQMTDNEVTAAMADAARTPAAAGHDPARRIIGREHFKILYEATPGDLDITLEPGQAVAAAAGEEFGPGNVKHTQRAVKSGAVNFPVLLRDGTVASSLALSSLLGSLPSGASDFVFVAPDRHDEAKRWLDRNRHDILSQTT